MLGHAKFGECEDGDVKTVVSSGRSHGVGQVPIRVSGSGTAFIQFLFNERVSPWNMYVRRNVFWERNMRLLLYLDSVGSAFFMSCKLVC